MRISPDHPLRRLAARFEYRVHGLNRVKADLEFLRRQRCQAWKRHLGGD